VVANIQLDAEKLEVISPDLALETVTPEIQAVEHSLVTPDIEMGEPNMLNAQPRNVSCLIALAFEWTLTCLI
jgi:hypothetical protein